MGLHFRFQAILSVDDLPLLGRGRRADSHRGNLTWWQRKHAIRALLSRKIQWDLRLKRIFQVNTLLGKMKEGNSTIFMR
ncbi:MAG: hypothetical protein R3350_10130, partial [Saprospiraceae bacterium]|nr:hypothetical protein [Saprospiraceae bacterium]